MTPSEDADPPETYIEDYANQLFTDTENAVLGAIGQGAPQRGLGEANALAVFRAQRCASLVSGRIADRLRLQIAKDNEKLVHEMHLDRQASDASSKKLVHVSWWMAGAAIAAALAAVGSLIVTIFMKHP